MSKGLDPFWKDEASPQDADRRSAPRYQWALGPACPLFATLEGYPWPAKVENISTGGVSLAIRHRFDPGTELALELLNATKMRGCKMAIRVAHVKPAADGGWVMGCAFTRPLTEAEQVDLLS